VVGIGFGSVGMAVGARAVGCCRGSQWTRDSADGVGEDRARRQNTLRDTLVGAKACRDTACPGEMRGTPSPVAKGWTWLGKHGHVQERSGAASKGGCNRRQR
jgi:hypothetical protein